MDLNNDQLLKIVLKTKKLLIISTGLSNEEEIKNCVKIVKNSKKKNVVFLHCISVYPPSSKRQLNLGYINRLKQISGFQTGFSDHTIGYEASVIAAFLGATVIEKHFTDNRKLKGWDHHISADFNIMSNIVNFSKDFKKYLGESVKIVSREEKDTSKVMRRSICLNQNVKRGQILDMHNLTLQRPGYGIDPKI